jgi:hypothetical protein
MRRGEHLTARCKKGLALKVRCRASDLRCAYTQGLSACGKYCGFGRVAAKD